MKRILNALFFLSLLYPGFLLYPYVSDAVLLLFKQHTSEAIVRMHLRTISDTRFNDELFITLEEDDIETANQIYAIGLEKQVIFDDQLLIRLKKANSTLSGISRTGKDLWNGISTGEVTSTASLTGAVVSGLTGVSDFRDLSTELDAYPDYDSFTVGLSLVGITATAMTVSSFFTGGTSAVGGVSARVGVTAVKGLRTAGKLSKKLERTFSKHTDVVIDKKVLSEFSAKLDDLDLTKVDAKQIDELSVLAKNAINPKAAKPLISAVDDMRVIGSNSGFVGIARSLTIADDFNDINRLKKLSAVTKKSFTGIIKLAPKIAKPIYKALRVLFEAVFFIVSSIFWSILTAWRFVRVFY
ncbi:hypothetical protein [Rheinheimera sp. WS51]|uniref:hypothetical protein n=1 Tax=Rheinheimera sp. WS51 TaxID=3425886 RepID=UPI003D8B33C2